MKDGSRRLNLLTFDGSEKFDDIFDRGYSTAIERYAARRLPPLSPEEVTRRLETELKFTGRGDIPVVAELYRTFFEHAAMHAKRLDFGRLGWGSEQLEQLVELFPRFLACEELNLAGNNLASVQGPMNGRHMSGVIKLAEALPQSKLQSLKCAAALACARISSVQGPMNTCTLLAPSPTLLFYTLFMPFQAVSFLCTPQSLGQQSGG